MLGVTAAEDTVYRRLLAAVSASGEELTASTGLPPADVRTSLAALVERGLAAPMEETPTRFVAASPSVIEAMIAERLAELHEARETLDVLTTRYRANTLARAADGVFEIVRGGEALRDCSLGLLHSARSEVLNLIKPPLIALQPEEGEGPPPSVRNRIVYETSVLEHDGIIDVLRIGARAGDEARAHTKLPIKMLVVDRSAALLPLAQHDSTPVGVLLRESALLDAMCALFEYVWQTAIPLDLVNVTNGGSTAPTVLDADERELLSLLLAGLSDEAIAMHHGQSVRTVQRKVHALMEAANVRTRIQLAWEAARLRLLQADVEPEDLSLVVSGGNGDSSRPKAGA